MSRLHEFIDKAKETHNNVYNYDLIVDFKGVHTKVSILCNEHGVFTQTPASHLSGASCPKCGRKKAIIKLTCDTEKFMEKARKIHGEG